MKNIFFVKHTVPSDQKKTSEDKVLVGHFAIPTDKIEFENTAKYGDDIVVSYAELVDTEFCRDTKGRQTLFVLDEEADHFNGKKLEPCAIEPCEIVIHPDQRAEITLPPNNTTTEQITFQDKNTGKLHEAPFTVVKVSSVTIERDRFSEYVFNNERK